MSISGRPSHGVCLVPATYMVSGTERITLDIATELHKTGTPVYAIVPGVSALDKYAEELSAVSQEVHRIGDIREVRQWLDNFLKARRVLAKWNPACLHLHTPYWKWGTEIIAAAQAVNISFVVRTEHNPLISSPSKLLSQCLKVADKKVNHFTYVSEGNQSRFETSFPWRMGRGLLVQNGVNTQTFRPAKSEEARSSIRAEFGLPLNCHLAVFVGSFGGRRPLVPIFDAFKQLLADPKRNHKASQWRFLVIGHGESSEIEAASAIRDYVCFAGRRERIHEVLPHCDLFLSASHFEGMSIAMLEAWSCGIPVLTTDVDGISDITGNEEKTKIVVPHRDTAAFADAWYKVMACDREFLAIQQSASETVRARFDTATMLSQYLRLYEGV